MACIVETSSGLLVAFLLEHGWSVYPVHPTTVDRRRAAKVPKTDIIDAYLLAKTGRADFAELRRLTPDSQTIAELKVLTRDQDALIQMQTRLVNQLTACRSAYYPVVLDLFSKLQQRSRLPFLRTYPTLQAAQAASVEQITEILKQAGHTSAGKVAPEIFESLPRAGKRLTPRLLAEIGDDRTRYADEALLQALAGTSPVIFQSGTYRRIHRRHACIKPLRNALHQFAWQTTLTETWALEYYQRKRKEGKSHRVAVRALANVWVRIMYAMWQKSECYQAATFEQARLEHLRRVA